MDFIVKFGIFFLGVLTSVFLIPTIEKKKAETLRKESLKEVFIELEDIYVELAEDLTANFKFLLNLRSEPDLAGAGQIPVPMPQRINSDVLIDLYKKSALLLTSPQRLAIKRIPSRLSEIEHHSDLYLNEYERRGFTNSSNLATFFVLGDFIAKSTNTKELITYYKPKIEQGRYSDLSVSQTLLNGMVRSGYLKLDTGKYYLSETGYNCYLEQNSEPKSFSRLSIANRFFQEHQTLMFLLAVIGIGIGIASLA